MNHHMNHNDHIEQIKEYLMAIVDSLVALSASVDRVIADDQAKTQQVTALEAQVASLDPNAAADLATAQAELSTADAQVVALTAKLDALVPPPVPFSVPSLTVSGTAGTELVATAIAVTGGSAPYTFAVDGSVPDGVIVDTLGNISGTPTVAFAGQVNVTATDSTGATAAGVVSFQIS